MATNHKECRKTISLIMHHPFNDYTRAELNGLPLFELRGILAELNIIQDKERKLDRLIESGGYVPGMRTWGEEEFNSYYRDFLNIPLCNEE